MAKHPSTDEEYAKYEAAIERSKDVVSRILLTQLYLEHLLERYIDSKVSKAKQLFGRDGLSFTQKVNLAYAFSEMDEQLCDSLRKVNKLRNDIAHRMGFDIDQKTIDDLGRTLGKHYSEIKKNATSKDEILPRILARLSGVMARKARDSESSKT